MKAEILYLKNKTLHFLFLVIASCGFLFSSCLKGIDSRNDIISAVTVINGSPNAPAFDFVLNGEPVFPSNRAFTQRIPYFHLFAGNYQAKFYIHNTYSNAFHTTNIQLITGKYHSLFLAGLAPDSLTSLLIEDDLSRPSEGKAKLRFLNLSPNAGPLDFSIVSDSLFASQKKFKDYTSFYVVEAGDYSAKFISNNIVTYEFDLKLEKGKIYTVWAKGLIGTNEEDLELENGLIVHDLD